MPTTRTLLKLGLLILEITLLMSLLIAVNTNQYFIAGIYAITAVSFAYLASDRNLI